jgi:hypothetical protein
VQRFIAEKYLRLIPLNAWAGRYRDIARYLLNAHFLPVNDSQVTNIKRLAEIRHLVVLFETGRAMQQANLRPNSPNVYTDYIDTRPFVNMPPNINMYILSALGREITYGLLGAVEFDAAPFSDSGIYSDTLTWLLLRMLKADAPASGAAGEAGAALDKGLKPLAGGVEETVNQGLKPLAGGAEETVNKGLEPLVGGAEDGVEDGAEDGAEEMVARPDNRSEPVREALKICVPAFEGLPEDELLAFRLRRRDELRAFRQVLDDFTTQVRASALGGEALEEVERQICARLRPCIADLERTVGEQAETARNRRGEQVSVISLDLTAFVTWPLEAIVLPSILKVGKWPAEQIEALRERIKLRRNGVYFLWERTTSTPGGRILDDIRA